MALAMLCHEAGLSFHVLHFDHNLREGSAAEAQALATFFKSKNIPFHCGTWQFDKKPTGSRIQAEARTARYAFFKRQCAALGLSDVLLGHTANDVAETFLMRLFYGSGLQGLKPMAAQQTTEEGLTIHRPLLSLQREDLRAYLKAIDCPWLEDPSNANADFVRVRARYWLDKLDVLESLATLSQKFKGLDVTLAPLEENLILQKKQHQALIDVQILEQPDFVQARLIKHLVKDLAGHYPPRTKQIKGLITHLKGSTKARELGHLRWQRQGKAVSVQVVAPA